MISIKVISFSELQLKFTIHDIPKPPLLTYSENFEKLVQDWNCSSYIRIKGVPIPLKYWQQVCKDNMPNI